MFGADEPLYPNHTVWYLWKREKLAGKLVVHWAAIMSLLTWIVHVFVGGAEIVRPLLASNQLNQSVRFTLYYCWHLVTIAIMGMVIAYILLAVRRGGVALAWYATITAIAFAGWSVLMIILNNLSPLIHGQWIAFLLIAAAGIVGSVTMRRRQA